LLLKVMEPGREYVLRELIPLYDRALPATRSALEDRLIKRGLAEKRRNPATADALRRSHRKGETSKQFKSPAGIPDAWLYRLTERGVGLRQEHAAIETLATKGLKGPKPALFVPVATP
jgi:hypothetical protein